MLILELEEARMSPSTFAAAIEQGTGQGVLVGFEFEVLVPKATIDKYKQPVSTKYTVKNVAKIISEYDVFSYFSLQDLTPSEFDDLFKLKPDARASYPTAKEAYDVLRQNALEKCKELFNQLPEDIRKKYIPKVMSMRREYQGLDDLDKQLRFCYLLGQQISISKKEQKLGGLAYKLQYQAKRIDWEGIFQAWLGISDVVASMRVGEIFNFDPNQVYSSLALADFIDDMDQDFDYDQDYDYQGAARVLEPAVAQAFGTKVNVFQSYHQKQKNLTDWYIEPDGSLQPSSSTDGAAEIVSPPLSASQSIVALKNFYTMAQQLGLYTNSSTGIHINVSVPEKIDLLKLAVFLGDQYVLAQFGRQDSKYAISAQRSIARQIQSSDIPLVNRKASDYAKLQKIAKMATGTHTASISDNGKYISFRHAGGDYLADYAKIFNTVGRFIRAMLIAADPNAYAQEYKSKVNKLLSQRPSQNGNMPIDIRTNGLPVYTVDLWRTGRTAFQSIVGGLPTYFANFDSFEVQNIEQNSEQAKQNIVNNIRSPEFKEDAQNQPVGQFATATVIPLSIEAMNGIRNAREQGVLTSEGRGRIQGYGLVRKTILPPNHPATQNLLKQLLQRQLQKK
jgi:hypothetical protein